MTRLMRREDPSRGFTLAQLAVRWNRPLATVKTWVYRDGKLKVLQSTRGRGTVNRVSKAEVRRFERTYTGVYRDQESD